MFLETEATFPYYNWSIKMARIIGFCSTSVVNSSQRIGCLPFWVYVKVEYSFEQKHILKLASKRKISAKKNQKRLPQVWLASVFSPSSTVFSFPLVKPWHIQAIMGSQTSVVTIYAHQIPHIRITNYFAIYFKIFGKCPRHEHWPQAHLAPITTALHCTLHWIALHTALHTGLYCTLHCTLDCIAHCTATHVTALHWKLKFT